uniref:Disease resistance protein RPM1 n=1 Tax=Zea mays TaxID=4577 RepID=A0A804QST1_MAIZE
MAEAIILALRKIGSALADETAKKMLAKLSEKVNNLRDLNDKIESIRMQLTAMNNVICKIGTIYLTDEVVRGWIGEVRKVAYHVEDVMDMYSYHTLQMEEEWFLKKYFIKASHYVLVFSQIAEEVIKVEKEIKKVVELKNLRRLTEWLYSDELDSTVITVSGMGGLGKTTLVTNVYEREKTNFSATTWMVVSQTYTIEALLRKLLMKVGREEQVSPNIDKLDVHDLKENIKQKLDNRKCLIVLDDVWDQEVYLQMSDAFQNLAMTSCWR